MNFSVPAQAGPDTVDQSLSSNISTTESATCQTIPVILLKTRSTPTDSYETHFTSSTRLSDQPTPLNGLLTRRSSPFRAIFVPVLQHTFSQPSLAHLRSLLSTSAFTGPRRKYGGIILTSQRAVEALGSLVDELTADKGVNGDLGPSNEANPNESPLFTLEIPFYTVGPATSRALTLLRDRHFPKCTVEGAHTGNGEKLAEFILEHYNNLWHQRHSHGAAEKPPLLFLVGEQRRDIIPKVLASNSFASTQRIAVSELIVYETSVMESFAADFTAVLARTKNAPVRWVVVFSPTGCQSMLKVLGWWSDESTGKVTARIESAVDKGSTGNEGGLTGNKAAFGRNGECQEVEEKIAMQGEQKKVFVACIGPTTRDYLEREFGFVADVCAPTPSPVGVSQGIETFLNDRGLVQTNRLFM
ncbi:hypothetical protein MMC06_001005 [Schaereria dolodes]|nr:hypothetical protein [Schaereria dolodes]